MCMGAEAIWVPAAIAALGAGTTAMTQRDAMKRQDQEAARGIMRQAEIQRQAGSRVQDNIKSLRDSSPAGEQSSIQAQFMEALRKANLGASNDANFASAPGGSGRFAEDVNAARVASGAEGTAAAGRLSRIDAPMYQRVREGQRGADTASQLSLLQTNSANEDFLTRLRTAAQQPNPWLMAAGSALQSYGGSMAGRAPGVKKPLPMSSKTLIDSPPINPIARYA